MNNTDKLYAVFREVLGATSVDDNTTRGDIPEWNSLQTINLILALEETFSVQFTPEESAEMLSVGLVKDILTEKGVCFP